MSADGGQSNIRIPMPTALLNHEMVLCPVLQKAYFEYHPIRLLAEARNLCAEYGDPYSELDLQAAMFLIHVRRISDAFPLALTTIWEDRLRRDISIKV